MLTDATQMKPNVLSAVHLIAGAWRLITLTAMKNCSVNCGFSIMSAVMITVQRMTGTIYRLLEG
jgi:hypothetical protein